MKPWNNRTILSICLFAYLFIGLFAYSAYAATGINHTINFQGKLTNPDGTNVADSTYSIVFSLYTVSSGGTAAWTETDSVTTKDGVFRVALGANTTFASDSIDFNSDTYYLGVKVGSDAEMTPRVQFTAVPYAYQAQEVNGLTVTDNGGNTLNIAANKTLTVNNSLTFAGVDGKTLTTNNSLTLAGTDGKTFTINNSLTFGGTDGTSFTFPSSSGTVCVSGQACATSGTVGYWQRTASGGLNYLAPATLADQLSVGIATPTLPNAGLYVESNNFNTKGNALVGINQLGNGPIFTASQSGNTKFVIDNAGNVGIGTTTPGEIIDVANSSLANVLLEATANSGTAELDFNSKNSSGTTKNASIFEDANGRLNLSTSALGSSTRMSIDANGNVGIGTVNQGNPLEVQGSGQKNQGTIATGYIHGTSSFATLNVENDGVGDLFTASAGATPKFVITNAGNVGVGTTTPSEKLQVAGGNILLDNSQYLAFKDNVGVTMDAITFTSANNLKIANQDSTGNLQLGIATASNTTGKIQFLTGNSVERMRLDAGGNLGIGTNFSTNPALGTLDVRGNTGTTPIATFSGATSFAGLVVDNSGTGDLFTASASGLNRFVITQNGNVGIGSTPPTAMLTVAGNVLFKNASDSTSAFQVLNSSGSLTLNADTSDDRLGIGTATPATALDVRGTVQLSGGTLAVASISGKTSFASLVVNNDGVGDVLAASSSSIPIFQLKNTGALILGNATNGLTFDPVNGGPTYSGTARITKQIVLSAEYAGATLTASGSGATSGNMTSDASPSANLSGYAQAAVPGSFAYENYYQWAATGASAAQYTIAVRVTLPKDFSSWVSGTSPYALTIDYNTADTNSVFNSLDAYIYQYGDTSAKPVAFRTGKVSGTAKNWTQIQIPSTDLTSVSPTWDSSHPSVMIFLTLHSTNTFYYVQVGDITLNYLAKF